jgi:hypothetical protein
VTPRERIEEAHGLWELAVVRLATLASVGAKPAIVNEAAQDERDAFAHWTAVSRRALAEEQGK